MKNILAKEVGSLLGRHTTHLKASYACRHFKTSTVPRQHLQRQFHNSPALKVVKPYLLADIGEGMFGVCGIGYGSTQLTLAGITECQVIQWFVQPGARVEQFDPICEVQSDKASVEVSVIHTNVFQWALLIHVCADHLAVRWRRQEALL